MSIAIVSGDDQAVNYREHLSQRLPFALLRAFHSQDATAWYRPVSRLLTLAAWAGALGRLLQQPLTSV